MVIWTSAILQQYDQDQHVIVGLCYRQRLRLLWRKGTKTKKVQRLQPWFERLELPHLWLDSMIPAFFTSKSLSEWVWRWKFASVPFLEIVRIAFFLTSLMVFVDIKILWWIYNRPIVHGKIFAIKLISNWWRGQSANEIKPHSKIKWRKPYGSVRRKDQYGNFLLNKIPN